MAWLLFGAGNNARDTRSVPRNPNSPFRSDEFQDHGIHRKAIAWLGVDFFYRPVDLRAQHVFHFHGLNNRDRFASLDLLALLHGDRDDQAGHWAEHLFACIGNFPWRHQPRIAGFALGVDKGLSLVATVAQRKAIRERAYLCRDRPVVDRSAPHSIARLPIRPQSSNRTVALVKTYIDDVVLAFHLKLDLTLAKPDRALALTRHVASAQLARDAPLAVAQNMVDGGSDTRNHLSQVAFGRLNMKPCRKFFGDE